VITGFNTDIRHADRVYHVQTEDRGVHNPVVESLVYVGGEILLSKKSTYKELIKGDKVDEKAVREMMDLQHRRIIEAIRRGRLDGGQAGEDAEWGEDTLPSTSSRLSPAALAAAAAILSVPPDPLPGATPAGRRASSKEIPVRVPEAAPTPRVVRPFVPPAAHPAPAGAPQGRRASGAAAATAAPPAPAPPAAPLKPLTRIDSGVRSLDQVIVEYLASEAASEHLELSLIAGGELVAGESVILTARTATSLTEKPIAGAHISIRIVSTMKPPQVLFRGVTGNDGLVRATVDLPDLGSGNGALIIAASSQLGNNEIKQLIRKKGS